MIEGLTVNLGERSYAIHIGATQSAAVQSAVASYVAAGRKIAIVTDRNLAREQADLLRDMFGEAPTVVVEPGEETKSLSELGRVLDFLAEQRIDRAGLVFAVGGGVIGDLAGFAAASYLRGVDFIQVPTTLLAMVDSSVGGKTGINLKAGKNLVGAFHQPKAVFIATDVLHTLPAREFAAGMAEVIKCGLLGDEQLFTALERKVLAVDSPELPAVIRTCCELKAHIVEVDERELVKEGGRALLNLGHTFGHAIEQATAYGSYLHGEAIAIGLVAAARLSAKLSLITWAEVGRVEQVLAAHDLPIVLRESLPVSGLMAAMARDKKVRGGLPRFVVLKALGLAATQAGIDPSFVEAVWREVGAK